MKTRPGWAACLPPSARWHAPRALNQDEYRLPQARARRRAPAPRGSAAWRAARCSAGCWRDQTQRPGWQQQARRRVGLARRDRRPGSSALQPRVGSYGQAARAVGGARGATEGPRSAARRRRTAQFPPEYSTATRTCAPRTPPGARRALCVASIETHPSICQSDRLLTTRATRRRQACEGRATQPAQQRCASSERGKRRSPPTPARGRRLCRLTHARLRQRQACAAPRKQPGRRCQSVI